MTASESRSRRSRPASTRGGRWWIGRQGRRLLLATIPSRLEYLLILLVCLLAVGFFALALGLVPAKVVRRVAGLIGSGNGGHGGGGGQHAHLSPRIAAPLFVFEHWASTLWHRFRAVTLLARYGRTRSGATAV